MVKIRCPACRFAYFNSIKVRLKLTKFLHKNTTQKDFNSIKVRLKLRLMIWIKNFHFYFNSIKVRLKLSSEKIRYHEYEFQFHKGTIKTCCCRTFRCGLCAISIP